MLLFSGMVGHEYVKDSEELEGKLKYWKMFLTSQGGQIYSDGSIIALTKILNTEEDIRIYFMNVDGTILSTNDRDRINHFKIDLDESTRESHSIPLYINQNLEGEFLLIQPPLHEIYLFKYFLLSILLLSFSYILYLLILKNRNMSAVATIVEQMKRDQESPDFKNVSPLISYLSKSINEYRNELRDRERLQIISDISKQVAHDIKSPLAALESSISNIVILPDGQKNIINNALERINNISNDLLQKSGLKQGNEVLLHSCLIECVNSITLEKIAEYDGKNIDISLLNNIELGECPALFSITELKRIISNLINNSVEASEEKIVILVKLFHFHGTAIIDIVDNGKGIKKENLSKVFEKGLSIEKSHGNGLGLSHAKLTIESWGGSITAISEYGKGATMRIELPLSRPTQLKNTKKVVHIDDDSLIRMTWEAQAKSHNIELLSLESSDKLYDVIDKLEADCEFYIDSNLGDGQIKGEELAQELYNKGFLNVNLSTGYDSSEFQDMPWINKVIGKAPPWVN